MTHTALPTDPSPEGTTPSGEATILVPDSWTRLCQRMHELCNQLSATDFAGIQPQREKTQYTHSHKQIKRKGGRPPIDYSAVEHFVDLQLHLSRGEYNQALPLYYYIRRLTSG